MNLLTILCLAIAFVFFWSGKVVSSLENVDELAQRREVLRNMTKEALKLAWRKSAPLPLNKTPWPENDGQAIMSAMSTLWVMGLKEEFDEGREWIRSIFGNFSQSEKQIDVRVYMNEFVGSLLSCFALTNDTLFRDKAFEIARALQPAYDNQTGIPSFDFVPKTKERKLSFYHKLADIGGTVLETRYLHSLAPEQFIDRTNQWRNFLDELSRNEPNQVMPILVDANENDWSSSLRSLFSFGAQPLYACLVKAYIQSNGSDVDGLNMFVKAIEAAEESQMITKSNKTGLVYIRNYWNNTKTLGDNMEYEGCNYAAILQMASNSLETSMQNNQILGSKTNQQLNQTISKYLNWAKEIAETCHFAANKTATKLPPRALYFNAHEEADNFNFSILSFRDNPPQYAFDSGLEESYFVLWRATKDQKYRDYAWELTQAIQRHARVGNGDGFGVVINVNVNHSIVNDYQPLDILSRAFKFLYLTFAEDSTLPMDQWVFSPSGHPFPICGKNKANPKC